MMYQKHVKQETPKILFISGNLCDGGAQRVISVVSSRLFEIGYDVSVLTFCRNEKEYTLGDRVKRTNIRESFAEYSAMSLLARTQYIRRYLKDTKPDIAVGFLEGGYALFLASLWLRHIKKVASARIDPKVILEEKGMRAIINRTWFKHADSVVLQTKAQLDQVSQNRWKRQTVIPNPVSDAAFDQPEPDYDRPCRRIVMAGRLVEQKNYPMAFRAMKLVREHYPDVTLDVFGKGSQDVILSTMIHDLELENCVHLRGWSQRILSEYANSDLYLLSSNYEGLPNALMEAMAVGLPCVSSECDTGPADLITSGENGFLVPVNDHEAMAQQIIKIVGMVPTERRRLGENASRTMHKLYTSDAVSKQWGLLFEHLMRD